MVFQFPGNDGKIVPVLVIFVGNRNYFSLFSWLSVVLAYQLESRVELDVQPEQRRRLILHHAYHHAHRHSSMILLDSWHLGDVVDEIVSTCIYLIARLDLKIIVLI